MPETKSRQRTATIAALIGIGPPVAFHRGIMRRNELCREHSFNSSLPLSVLIAAEQALAPAQGR
jgi:hypothetical protein